MKKLVAVKVFKYWAKGGFIGKETDLFLLANGGAMGLGGAWKFRPGYLSQNPDRGTEPNSFPANMYNSMVHPFTGQTIKGVLCYKGEENTNRPVDYEWHLRSLIQDWRSKWQQPALSFILVQLQNINQPAPERKGGTVLIRSAQQAVADMTQVGSVVNIDICDLSKI